MWLVTQKRPRHPEHPEQASASNQSLELRFLPWFVHSMSDYILGIDPGFSGGIALVHITGKLEWAEALPTICKTFGDKNRVELDIKSIAEFFIFLDPIPSPKVFIENVTASPQMGVTSAFRFGEGFGVLVGILAAYKFEVTRVHPSAWKPAMNLSAKKQDSLLMASKLWPKFDHIWKLKKNDGLAEAALIAEFGRRSLPGQAFGDLL